MDNCYRKSGYSPRTKMAVASQKVTPWSVSGPKHYSDVIMSVVASHITSLTIAYSIVYSGADQRKHQSSATLAFVRGIHRWPVNSPKKWPVMQKMFPFDDVIMKHWRLQLILALVIPLVNIENWYNSSMQKWTRNGSFTPQGWSNDWLPVA